MTETHNYSAFQGKSGQIWFTIHQYQNNETSISLTLHEGDKLRIVVNDFSITLNIGQTNVIKERVPYKLNTCEQAIAWTFGMSPSEYNLTRES